MSGRPRNTIRDAAARVIQRSWIRSRRRRVNRAVRRSRVRRNRKKITNNSQLATIGQVKRLIAKDQDPEYLKVAIGCQFENANIGTGATAQINCFRMNQQEAFNTTSIWSESLLEFPTATTQVIANGATGQRYGNKRTDLISLKKGILRLNFQKSVNHDVFVKVVVFSTTRPTAASQTDADEDRKNALRSGCIATLPLSVTTVYQNRKEQGNEVNASFAQTNIRIEYKKTLLLKTPLDNPAGADKNPNRMVRIQWVKKFGKNGKKVNFLSTNTQSQSNLRQYYLIVASVRANGTQTTVSTGAAAIERTGIWTTYWENIPTE